MKKIVIMIPIILIIGILIILYNQKPQVILKKNLTAEINTEHTNLEYINIKKGKIVTKSKKINTSSLGKKTLKITMKNNFGKKTSYSFKIKVVDTEKPVITYSQEIQTEEGTNVDLLKDVIVTDNSKEEIKATVEGTYDINKAGEYILKYIAVDSSENKAENEFKLIVKEKPKPKAIVQASNKNPYYIKINRAQNVVMVYGLNNNEYTKLVKTFICSTGRDTPLGTFNTTDKYVWRALVGGVYGQYATRITGSILFHSVPYFSQNKNDLEYEEYNKLGTKASLGCIRLTVRDAKWIYDNCPKGTTVNIYDGGEVTKPTFSEIDIHSPNKGWDPTDPDPNNPWN